MGSYLIGLAGIMLQACTEVKGTDRDKLCGNWESVEGKPKVTVFRKSGKPRRLKPKIYLLQEEDGNLFIHTGFRIDVSYNEAADILTFSPNGDYIRVKDEHRRETKKQE